MCRPITVLSESRIITLPESVGFITFGVKKHWWTIETECPASINISVVCPR